MFNRSRLRFRRAAPLTLGLALAAASAFAAPRHAHAPAAHTAGNAAAIRQALQALYDQQDTALTRRDVRQAMTCYAPGYVAVGQDGVRHTRDEQFDALEKVCGMGENLRQHSQIQKIVAQGGRASLVLWQEATMTVFNPNTHAAVALRTEGVSQDLWVRTPDGWRLTYSKSAWVQTNTDTGADTTPAAAAPAPPANSSRPKNTLTAQWK